MERTEIPAVGVASATANWPGATEADDKHFAAGESHIRLPIIDGGWSI